MIYPLHQMHSTNLQLDIIGKIVPASTSNIPRSSWVTFQILKGRNTHQFSSLNNFMICCQCIPYLPFHYLLDQRKIQMPLRKSESTAYSNHHRSPFCTPPHQIDLQVDHKLQYPGTVPESHPSLFLSIRGKEVAPST